MFAAIDDDCGGLAVRSFLFICVDEMERHEVGYFHSRHLQHNYRSQLQLFSAVPIQFYNLHVNERIHKKKNIENLATAQLV